MSLEPLSYLPKLICRAKTFCPANWFRDTRIAEIYITVINYYQRNQLIYNELLFMRFIWDLPKNEISWIRSFSEIYIRSHSSVDFLWEDFKKKRFYEDFWLNYFFLLKIFERFTLNFLHKICIKFLRKIFLWFSYISN